MTNRYIRYELLNKLYESIVFYFLIYRMIFFTTKQVPNYCHLSLVLLNEQVWSGIPLASNDITPSSLQNAKKLKLDDTSEAHCDIKKGHRNICFI